MGGKVMSFYGKASKPKFESKIIPAGDYECRVISALEKVDEDGASYIEFQFKVREDIDQNCKGSIIKKRFKPDQNGNYKVDKINEFAFACGVEEGADYQLEELAGACVIVHINCFTAEDTGKKVGYVAYLKESEVGDTAKPLDTDSLDSISTDDIPF
jgi:hypothetical protein